MTPEKIKQNLRYIKNGSMYFAAPPDHKIVKDFWFNTGCLAGDLVEMTDDDLNELWARFVFDRIAEAKEA